MALGYGSGVYETVNLFDVICTKASKYVHVEGLQHRTLPIRTYQYHPEGAPGPHDNEYVFDEFISRIRDAVASR